MLDQVASFLCPHCSRSFARARTCQRHVRRSHAGAPLVFPTPILLHGAGGPEGGVDPSALPIVGGTLDEGGASIAAHPPSGVDAGGLGVGAGDGDIGKPGDAEDEVFPCPAHPAVAGSGLSVCARVRELYEAFDDRAGTKPMFMGSVGLPQRFTSPFLRGVLFHATLSTRTGSPASANRSLLRLMTGTPDGGHAPQRSAAAVMKAAFKSPSSFSTAVKNEQERLVYLAGWMETSLPSLSGRYDYMHRDPLALLLQVLRDAPVKHLFTPAAAGAPKVLVGPSRGGIFEMYEAEVRKVHGDRAFVLPFSLFSDGCTLPNSGAASSHPLRIAAEFLPADLPREWLSAGNFPQVMAQLGRGGSERAKVARRELLQRAMFLTLDNLFKASHDGVRVDLGGDLGMWLAFPRMVCYSADYPEKRIVLCLRGVGCMHLCSSCLVKVDVACSATALLAERRGAVATVVDQMTARALSASAVRGSKMEHDRLCEQNSCNALPPALACMAGLLMRPYLLLRAFGFDTLHVSFAIRQWWMRMGLVRGDCGAVCMLWAPSAVWAWLLSFRLKTFSHEADHCTGEL